MFRMQSVHTLAPSQLPPGTSQVGCDISHRSPGFPSLNPCGSAKEPHVSDQSHPPPPQDPATTSFRRSATGGAPGSMDARPSARRTLRSGADPAYLPASFGAGSDPVGANPGRSGAQVGGGGVGAVRDLERRSSARCACAPRAARTPVPAPPPPRVRERSCQ